MNTTVRHLLDRNGQAVHFITPSATVYEAISRMSSLEIGSLLVMEGDQLLGILSERDYTRKIILMDRSSRTTKVEEIMTRNVLYVTPKNDINECMALMSDNNIRHLPVIENNKVTGVISIMDVISSIISDQEFIIEQLEHYITG
jgi:CBS domain-containing protein